MNASKLLHKYLLICLLLCTSLRHQSPEWMILSHIDYIQGEVVGFQVLLDVDSLIHVVRGRPGGLLQFFKREAVKILASVWSGIRAVAVSYVHKQINRAINSELWLLCSNAGSVISSY